MFKHYTPNEWLSVEARELERHAYVVKQMMNDESFSDVCPNESIPDCDKTDTNCPPECTLEPLFLYESDRTGICADYSTRAFQKFALTVGAEPDYAKIFSDKGIHFWMVQPGEKHKPKNIPYRDLPQPKYSN